MIIRFHQINLKCHGNHRLLRKSESLWGSVLTLGSYDGIHRGHREILSSVVHYARARNLPSVLITFDPHPRHVLEKNKAILPMLMSVEEKLEIIREIGLQYIHIIKFNDDFLILLRVNFWIIL